MDDEYGTVGGELKITSSLLESRRCRQNDRGGQGEALPARGRKVLGDVKGDVRIKGSGRRPFMDVDGAMGDDGWMYDDVHNTVQMSDDGLRRERAGTALHACITRRSKLISLILSVTLCDGTQTSLVRPLSWRMGTVRTCECGLPPLAGNPNPLGAIDETLV